MTSPSCDTCRELLVDYSDGRLSEARSREVAAHVAGCPRCRSELVLLERSLELARGIWEQSAAGAPLSEISLAARRPGRPRAAAALVACVAAAGLVIGAWWLLSPGSRDEVHAPKPAAPVPSLAETETEKPVPAPSSEEIDVETMIARAGRAARLAASAELLATQPGLEQYRKNTERYLAEIYRGTPAGEQAAARIGFPLSKEPES